jgi:hypothetical protein
MKNGAHGGCVVRHRAIHPHDTREHPYAAVTRHAGVARTGQHTCWACRGELVLRSLGRAQRKSRKAGRQEATCRKSPIPKWGGARNDLTSNSLAGSSAAKGEVQGDLSFDLDRLAVEQVRPVPPLPDRINSGLHERGMAAYQPEIFNRTAAADERI